MTSTTSNVSGFTVPNSLWNKIECSTARRMSFVCSRSRTCLPAHQPTFLPLCLSLSHARSHSPFPTPVLVPVPFPPAAVQNTNREETRGLTRSIVMTGCPAFILSVSISSPSPSPSPSPSQTKRQSPRQCVSMSRGKIASCGTSGSSAIVVEGLGPSSSEVEASEAQATWGEWLGRSG